MLVWRLSMACFSTSNGTAWGCDRQGAPRIWILVTGASDTLSRTVVRCLNSFVNGLSNYISVPQVPSCRITWGLVNNGLEIVLQERWWSNRINYVIDHWKYREKAQKPVVQIADVRTEIWNEDLSNIKTNAKHSTDNLHIHKGWSSNFDVGSGTNSPTPK